MIVILLYHIIQFADMRLSFLVLILSVLMLTFCRYDFHVHRKLSLPQLNQVNQIAMIANDQLAIVKGNLQQSTVTVLQGDRLSNKIKQITGTNLSSMPKVTSQQIYLNKGKQLNIKKQQQKIWQFASSSTLNGNMQSNRFYALIAQQKPCPTLLYLNLTQKTKKQRSYESGQECVFKQSIGLVKDTKNGQFVFAIKNYLYVLDQQTLDMKQKIVQTADIQFVSIDYNHNQIQNISTLILSSWSPTSPNQVVSYRRTKQDIGYIKYSKFYNPMSNIFLTSQHSGVSYRGSLKHEWRDLKTDMVSISYSKQQYLIGKQQLGVSHNENIFVISGNNNIIFYSINTNNKYQIQILFQLTIQQITSIRRNSGQFTTDDKYLIIKTYNNMTKIQEICKIDINNRNYTFIKDYNNQQNNAICSTFTIISAIPQQKLVAHCITNKPNTTQSQHILVIYKIDDLSVLGVLQNFPQVGAHNYRILYNIEWDNKFILQSHPAKDVSKYDYCISQLYQISASNTMIKLKQTDIYSYYKSKAVHKYIITMNIIDDQVSNSTGDAYLRVYGYQNWIQVNRYWYKQANYQMSNYIVSKQNILIVETDVSQLLKRTDVYDLSLNVDSWYLGSTYKQYYQGNPTLQSGYLIFHSHKLYYLFNNNFQSTTRPNKLIYNLNQLSISKIVSMSQQYAQQNIYANYIYIPKQHINNNVHDCSYTFYTYARTYRQITACSDSRNIIVKYRIQANKYNIQIRDILHINTYKIWSYSINSAQIQNIDYNSVQQLIYNNNTQINVMKTNKIQYSQQYGIVQFVLFDINTRKCMIVSGKQISDSTKTKIIYKDTPQTQQSQYLQHVYDQNVQMLVLDDICQLFITYRTASKVVDVWRIQGGKLVNVYTEVWDGVQGIKFVGQDRFMLQFQTTFQIVSIFANTTVQIQPQLIKQQIKQEVKVGNMIVAVNYNGQLLAKTSPNYQYVHIYQTIQQTQLVFFSLSQSQIVTGLSFSPNNSLIISSNTSNLYIINPSSCPPTYWSINLYCMCRGNASEVQGYCKCDQHFVQDSQQQCICPQSFQYTNQQCRCDYGYIDVQDQQCYGCSFPCQTCGSSANDCHSYRASFIIIIALACAMFVLIVFGVLYWARKRKVSRGVSEQKQKLNKDQIQH